MLTVARMSSSHSKQNASIPTSLGTTSFALRGQFQPKISPRYHPVGILFRFRALRGEAEEGLFHPYFPTENSGVAGGGIEPPTRGFSVHVTHEGNSRQIVLA